MFDYIIGQLTYKEKNIITLEVNSIGYKIFLPLSFFAQLSINNSKDLQVFIYHYISETESTFYGFPNRFNREIFILLNSVSGIGPKLALKILSFVNAQTILQYILNENLTAIKQIKGLGVKTSQKLLLETQVKAKVIAENFNLSIYNEENNNVTSNQENNIILETKNALRSLEYKDVQINKVIKYIFYSVHSSAPTTLEEAIKLALLQLSKN